MSLQKIYDRLPVPLQHLTASASGYQRNRSRYGREYWEHRRWLEGFDAWTLSQKLEYQRQELIRFVRRAAKGSNFYRDLYKAVDLGDLRSVDDLRRLPVGDTEMLRANIDAVVTVPRRGALEGHTGGITGKSLVVLMPPQDIMRRTPMLDHFKHRVVFEHRMMRCGKLAMGHRNRDSVRGFSIESVPVALTGVYRLPPSPC